MNYFLQLGLTKNETSMDFLEYVISKNNSLTEI